MVNRSAFETSDEADLVDRLRTDPAWIPGLSYVACAQDSQVVAHALLTRCRIGNVPALCLAPCAVLPEAQGRGAGTAVIRALLDAAGAQGERSSWCSVILATTRGSVSSRRSPRASG
ncbi:GNAT family N-acetyltransferase [Brachybacterium subflavum]|uniref:GNAT family N-acetyltransferase n=1 Tax=Brachybacterium subflavum TaxID=2585206 RepID=UPI001D0D73A7|nr:N-acetyltransferase [Brachybacterium subflavum]